MTSRRVVFAGGSLVFLSACASAPRNSALDKYPGAVDGRTTVVYYDVSGRTFDEVRADMHRKGPTVDGRSYVGETRSPMRWNYRILQAGTYCTLEEVRLTVNAQITLPRWTPPADAEPGLETEWKRFITALETHEAGHKDISARAGRDIVRQLSGLTDLCSSINSRANDFARSIIDRETREQKAYDAETRHGVTQGTSFGKPISRALRFLDVNVDSSGVLRIALSDRRVIQPEKDSAQVLFDQVGLSNDGQTAGWLALYPNCCSSYPVPLKLVLLHTDESRTVISGDLPIWQWSFASDGQNVVIQQSPVHGAAPTHYELRDIATGRAIVSFDIDAAHPAAIPAWIPRTMLKQD